MLWVNSDESSLVPIVAVSDKRMITDPERIGKVRWMPVDGKKKAPKNGWTVHDARILHVSG